jgi:hypothetical protein
MSRIRQAWVLPVVMVVLAQCFWAPRPPESRRDIYWQSYFDLFFRGLNAPADTAAILTYRVSWFRALSGYVVYMILTAMFWCFVGRKVDSWRHRKLDVQGMCSVGNIIGNSLSILFGLYLFLSISLHNVIFTKPMDSNGGGSNFYGDLIRQTLFFLWSLVLIFIPSITLSVSLRRRRRASLDH